MITTKCLKIEIIIMRLKKRLAKFALIKYRINFRIKVRTYVFPQLILSSNSICPPILLACSSITRVIMIALELFTNVCACAVRPANSSIHCLKPGGVVADAVPEISCLTVEMLTTPDDDNDPFASADEELETNELAVEDTD